MKLDDLPQEILDIIIQKCSYSDLTNCHLVSKSMAKSTKPRLFHLVILYLHPDSLNKVREIAASRLRHHVKSFLLHTTILPRFHTKGEWEGCVDIRPRFHQFETQMREQLTSCFETTLPPRWGEEELRALYDQAPMWSAQGEYVKYCSVLAKQEQLVRRVSPDFSTENLLRCFPNLREIEEMPWQYDTNRSKTPQQPIPRYMQWLLPDDTVSKSRRDNMETFMYGSQGIYASSILQNGLLGASILLPASSNLLLNRPQSQLRKLVLGVSTMVQDSHDESLNSMPNMEQYARERDDQAEIDAIWPMFFNRIESVSLPFLSELDLDIYVGDEEYQNEELVLGMFKIIRSAQSLKTLALTLSCHEAIVRTSFNLLDEFSYFQLPLLECLRLTGCTSKQATLHCILSNHSETLHELHIHDVYISEGLWEVLLLELPKMLTLRVAEIGKLVDISNSDGVVSEDGVKLDGAFCLHSEVEALKDYLLRGTMWPGMWPLNPTLSRIQTVAVA